MKKKHTYVLSLFATAAMAMLLVWGCKEEETVKLATLSTLSVTEIAKNTAKSGGDITNDGGGEITSRGVVWSLSQNPTIEQNLGYTLNIPGTGQFASEISDLTRYTKYYVRAYATNKAGVAYGNELEFTTEGEPSVITTEPITSITTISAVCGGNITDDGGASITTRGVVWSNSPSPTISENIGNTSNGVGEGSFTSELTNLTPNTIYYIRSFATNSIGTYYGDEFDFTTRNGICTITTTTVSNITINSAQTGGYITDDGGAAVTARGVVWSTAQNPTIEANLGFTSNGTETGSFTSNITGLSLGVTYFVRAYATNSVGTTYGSQQSFTTLNGLITLTTTAPTSILATVAESGGIITSDGGVEVFARGIVWSTLQTPTITINQGITSNSSGTGSFSSSLSGLTPNTTYYIRAYATNNLGTTYGNQQTFTTLGSITDADGNTYNIILINGQQWMKENLKTTKFNDGTDIPLVTDGSTWEGLSTPAYCWYNNDIANKPIYGALYNFYTVSTSNLCPTDWHVPTDAEWYAMENYVDPTINDPNATQWRGTNCSTKLKATSGWYNYGNGTDNYGFSALPNGGRFIGGFGYVGENGSMWSATEYNVTNAWYQGFSRNFSSVFRDFFNKKAGLSVRCIKD